MYIETEASFTDEQMTDRAGLINGIDQTIEFARINSDDWWGSGKINELVAKGQELSQLVSDEPSLESIAPVVEEMIEVGQYRGSRFDLPLTERSPGGCNYYWPHGGSYRGYATAMLERRLAMAKLYLMDANLADGFLDRKIVGLHGSGAIDLASVLQYGLLTHYEQKERGLTTFSGERLNASGAANFTSFVEWDEHGTSESYARRFGRISLSALEESVTSLPTQYGWIARKVEEQKDMIRMIESNKLTPWQAQCLKDPFEVVLGVSSDIFSRRQRVHVDSDIDTEFGFIGWGVAVEYLPLILVTKDKISLAEAAIKEYADNPDDFLVADNASLARSLNSNLEVQHLVSRQAELMGRTMTG